MSSTGLLQHICDPPKLSVQTLVCSKLFLSILPSVHIAIGTMYLNECPRQPYIPIYLIVSGVFCLMLALFSWLPCAQGDDNDICNLLSGFCMTWNSLTSFFIACWFIAGNVWIYSIYEPNYEKTMTDKGPYCDKTLYLYAFWITTLSNVFLALFLFCGCCALLCSWNN